MKTTKNTKSTFWINAAEAGGIIGLIIFSLYMLDALLKLNGAKGMLTVAIFLVLAVTIYFFTKKRSLKDSSPEGFTYGKSIGYILAMMLFTGFVVGVGGVLLQKFLAPDYYAAQLQAALENNPMLRESSEVTEQTLSLAQKIIQNPIVLVLSGMFGVLVNGGLVGLIVSAFVRTKPNVFGEGDQGIM